MRSTICSAIASAGGWRLTVESDFTKNFRASSPVARSYDFVETNLGGAGVWDVLVPAPDRLTWPYLAAVLKQYPQFFHGVCRVDPLDPAAPDRLSQLTEEGFRGVRLSPAADASGDWINGPLMVPLWQRSRSLKVPMTLLAPIGRVPDLQKLIDRFPDLTVVIDHMADCPVDQRGWEWHYLSGLADESESVIRAYDAGAVVASAVNCSSSPLTWSP